MGDLISNISQTSAIFGIIFFFIIAWKGDNKPKMWVMIALLLGLFSSIAVFVVSALISIWWF